MSLFKPPSLKVVHVNKKHHIASCVPYKSGSESARYLISSLSDGEQEEIKTMEELQDFTKIIQVREPFERLLSAYRFTFEKSETLGYPMSLSTQNFSSFSPAVWPKEDGTQIPSFQQFIEYIGVGFSKHGMDKDLYISGAPLHWVPQYMQCNPCSTQYNPEYLIKLESWIHDTTLLLDSINITTDRTFYLLNSTPGGHSSDLKLLKQYYSKISGKQMDRIYFHYRPDFLLFNYTYSQFKEKLSTP
ncbi:carbohydrate sulfotransferase 8 [Eurytemora carolleeae]|uniref:carbohydrate sulfotransferase 8 n=1 Tax=Eurytemora carolleeae TaxID=1294199 RepID=UPI000C78D096|nr:carbohydrate sulfotransferase 8 [Eurytemora carolleeae]|eukprot:XP_023349335.1 carbohydrate sulfotransferase 8-like [Eurytemora affinis]